MSGNGLVNIAVDYGDGRTSKSTTLDVEDAMYQVRFLLKRVAFEKQSIVSFSVTKADVFKSLGVNYEKGDE